MKLYVTRHGETEFNAQNRISGVTDILLTEEGIAQAKPLPISLSLSLWF